MADAVPPPPAGPARPAPRTVRVALAGYGTVGRALHRILTDQHDAIVKRQGIDLRLIGIARRDRFAASGADGLPLADGGLTWKTGNVFEMIGACKPDLLVEATPTDIETAQPALGHVRGALREGLHVVLANKGPLVVAFDEVMQRAAEAGVEVRFEATVGGCIPVLDTARDHYAGDDIERLEGILNGTTNFILTRMADEGSDLEQALREAQQLGYAETDPSADVDGLDAAAKVVILANAVLGRRLGLADVEVEGIRGVTRQAVELAAAHGHRVRLIAEVSRDGPARVGPRLVRQGTPLDVHGAYNAVRFTSALGGQTTHIGHGAGGRETASAVLSDILDICRRMSRTR